MGYPVDVFGMISWVRCRCGNSLTLRCDDSVGESHRMLAAAINDEARASGRQADDLMAELRDAVRRRATA